MGRETAQTAATAEPPAHEAALFRSGRFRELVQQLRAVGPVVSLPAGRLSLLVRGLLAIGRFSEAGDVCAEALRAWPPESRAAFETRLWQAQIRLYTEGLHEPAVQEGRAALEVAIPGSPSAGLVRDLLGRALAIASEWRLVPVDLLVEADRLLQEAALEYRQAGKVEDFLQALLRSGQVQVLSRNPAQARQAYAEVEEQAVAQRAFAIAAEAAVRSAELAPDVAAACYERALGCAVESGHRLARADVLASRGRRLVTVGLDGRPDLEEALAVYGREENLVGSQRTLTTLSEFHLKRGNLAEALGALQQSEEIARQMGCPAVEAPAILGLATYYYGTGEYARALAALERFEAIAPVPSVLGAANLTLASLYSQMNLPQRAEAACREAIRIFSPSGPNDSLSHAWLLLGHVRSGAGDWDGAIAAWREGLAVDQGLAEPLSKAQKILGIAQATTMRHYRRDGPPVPDSAFAEAMALHGEVDSLLSEVPGGEAAVLLASNDQIRAHSNYTQGRFPEALESHVQAASRYQSLGLEMQAAFATTQLGLILVGIGDQHGSPDRFHEAESLLRDALSYFVRAGMRERTWLIRYFLADVHLKHSRSAASPQAKREAWNEALKWLEDAADDLDVVRGSFIQPGLAEREEALLGLVSGTERVYELAILISAIHLEDGRTVLRWLERAKSRAFLDILALTPLQAPDGIDPSLVAEEQMLIEALRQAPRREAALSISGQIRNVWDRLAAQPAAAEYVAMRRGAPLAWDEVRRMLREFSKGRRAVLVQYFTSPRMSLMLVGREDFVEPLIFPISRSLVEIQEFVARHFGQVQGAGGSKLATHKISWLDENAFRQFFAPFIAPLAAKLPTGEPISAEGDLIWLVPHGLLHALPLHALEVEGRPLAERNPVTRSPSASALRFLRGKRKGRRKTALVFGDSIGDLRYAREEAREVAEIFDTDPALGDRASRSFLLEALASDGDQPDILHFACHGLFDSQQPTRSGIVLAAEPGSGVEQDILTARDVLSLRIRADLVTLSACQSGVNDRNPGDELIGLTRTWIYAGTPSVLATLWSIDDLPSQILVSRFYRELTEGTGKAEALRKAQLYLRSLTDIEVFAHYRARLASFEATGDRERAESAKRDLERVGAARRGESSRPFDHLYFWAPYVLVGDPE